MPKNPQTMIRTALAVVLMIGLAFIQQRWGGAPTPKSSLPSAASTETQAPVQPEASTAPDATTAEAVPVSTAVPKAPVSDGDFDFYLLTLSWSPTHCSSDEGAGRDDDLQCRSGRPYGFVLHGLWPQNERGYPESCPSNEPRRVSGDVLKEALKLSPSESLVQHEWEKHGTCSGLAQADYYAAAALALDSVRVPKAFKQPQSVIRITANDVRRAFLDANPGLSQAGILVTCRRNDIGEVRVCLDKELRPRACSRETLKSHCGGREARMLDVRGNWPRN